MGGESVEGEWRALAALQVKESRASDHGRVVGRQTRAGRKHRRTSAAHAHLHCGDQRRVPGYSAAEHDACAAECLRGAPRLLHERLDERIMETARDVGEIVRRGSANGVKDRRLQSAEGAVEGISVARLVIAAKHRSRESKSIGISWAGECLHMRATGIWQP